jgi:hypothetical protein
MLLRVSGWILLAGALAISVRTSGLSIGPTYWAGELTLSALVVAIVLTYRPRSLFPAMLAAILAALCALLFAGTA